ncbi:GRIP1-associated protein 1-like isoform X2 [Pelobates fuscus]
MEHPPSSCVRGSIRQGGSERNGHSRSANTVVFPAARPSELRRAATQVQHQTRSRNLGKKKDVDSSRIQHYIPHRGVDSPAYMNAVRRNLEEKNANLMKTIIEDEKRSLESATELLQQYNKTEHNMAALKSWSERQLREAQQDLEETRMKGEQRLKELQNQVEACDKKLRDAQKDLQQLRDYRDRDRSVKALEIADLQRQLKSLSDAYQDRISDVEALAQTELQNVSKKHENRMDGSLQRIAQHQIDTLPPSIKRMYLENKKMKKDIAVHEKAITELEDEIGHLRVTRNSLQRSARELIGKWCRDLLLHEPRCSPEEDLIFDIPENEDLPI